MGIDKATGTPDQIPDVYCRLDEVVEAVREGRRAELLLGVIACISCNGIFDVRAEAGERPEAKSLVFVPCLKRSTSNLVVNLEE